MSTEITDDVVSRADRILTQLRRGPAADTDIVEALALLLPLRNQRLFDRLTDLAEILSRYQPDDATVRCFYSQGLIECGRPSIAAQVLECTLRWPNVSPKEYSELQGLLGRAYKQLFIDTTDRDKILRERFLRRSSAAYAAAFDASPASYWHGINLCALAHAARRSGISLSGPSVADYAERVVAVALEATPTEKRDAWWDATYAEAHLASGNLVAAETCLGSYIKAADITPFHIGGTLRQLRELWAIHIDNEAGARLLQMLEAYLASQPGVSLSVRAEHVGAMQSVESVDAAQLQRVVGPKGMETLRWYRTGLQRAGSVAGVAELHGLPFGTAFAVSSTDFGIRGPEEILLLTNWHVLNSAGFNNSGHFGDVEVLFEAMADNPQRCRIIGVVAESPYEGGLDYALLRLERRIEGLRPLELAKMIASPTSNARVYGIGYPRGEVLQFSLEDNRLLDHECEPTGRPPAPHRRRVHYSAATEKGSSGSPVMDQYWRCIALHHKGAKILPPLFLRTRSPLPAGSPRVSAVRVPTAADVAPRSSGLHASPSSATRRAGLPVNPNPGRPVPRHHAPLAVALAA